MRRLQKYLAVGFMMTACVTAFANTQDERALRFHKANAAFDQAQDTAAYLAAAHQYEALLDEVENGLLYYNLGNAYLRADDVGRAILAYKRARQLIPASGELAHNLSKARQLRQDQFDQTSDSAGILSRLAFWHTAFSLRAKFCWAWGAFVAGWLLLGLRLWRPGSILNTVIICAFLVAACMGGSLAMDLYADAHHPAGVVLAQSLSVRAGNGMQYEKAFKEPVHAGTEFTRLEDRGEWWRIRISGKIEGWIKAEGADLVVSQD